MKQHLRDYRNLWVAVLLVAMFLAVAITTNYYVLNTVVQSLMMATALSVIVAYGPLAWQALFMRELRRERQLILGIVVAWTGTFLRSAAVVWWRLAFGETAAIQSDWVTFFNGMIVVGGILHITAPGVIAGKIPPSGWILLGITIGIGFTLAFVLLALQI